MKPSEFEIFISVKSYDQKTAESYLNCYVAEKPIVFKPSKILIQNLIAQIEDLNKDSVKFLRPYFYTFRETNGERALLSGRFIVQNDSVTLA